MKNIVEQSSIPYLEIQKYKKDRKYTFLSLKNCFALKSKLSIIKKMLDEGKTIAEINTIKL